MDFCAVTKKENTRITKNPDANEEPETEKDNIGKEKIGEQEQYIPKHNYNTKSQFQLSDKDKFTCFSAKLNRHPYQEDDIQPPQAV